jgi:[ribosomal protein S5]-alanine N-acetyltransferase
MEFNVVLRALRSSDAEFINSLRKIEEMEQKISGVKRCVSLEREIKWIQDLTMNDNQALSYFAVCERGSDAIIGYTSISDIDYRNGTCFWSGIKLAPEKSGKGYGYHVALIILRYVFEELRMVRCVAHGLEEHEIAIKMLIKSGYKKEGLMRKFVYKGGEHKNIWLFSILKEEYEEIKKKYLF